jgi:hypothetical protein
MQKNLISSDQKEPAIKMNRSADGESSRWKTFQYHCEKQILKKQNTSTLRYWAWFNDQTTTILHSIQQTTLFLRHFQFWKTRVWIIQQDFVNKVNTCVVLRLPNPSICLPNEITLRTQVAIAAPNTRQGNQQVAKYRYTALRYQQALSNQRHSQK